MRYQEQDDQKHIIEERRKRLLAMGMPNQAGFLHQLNENQRPYHIQQAFEQRFGHVMNGELKPYINQFDNVETPIAPMEYRDTSHLSPRRNQNMDPRQRKMEAMRQAKTGAARQHNVAPPPAPLPPVPAPNKELMEIMDMFGENTGRSAYGRQNYNPMTQELSMDSYGKGIPSIDSGYSQIKNKMNAVRQSTIQQGLDYRNLEVQNSSSRYSIQPTIDHNSVAGPDPSMLQEMAMNIARTTIMEFMNQHKGKSYFKKIKYNKEITPPDSSASNSELFIIEMEGKHYKVLMQPIKVKVK
jgi:hypothetical protein